MFAAILRSIDRFTVLLLITVGVATLLPASGGFATIVDVLANAFVVALFFLHGARLQREAVVAGLLHWRLHLAVLATSFVAFPLLGLALRPVADAAMPGTAIVAGLVYLACLPSTVQSSIAFVSLARGNVAAAICAASASNLIGVLVTPLLVGLLMAARGGPSPSAAGALAAQLLLPFLIGQLLHKRIGGWVGRNKAWLGLVDRGAILLMVYSAFGAAVLAGLWRQVSGRDLLLLFGLCALLLSAVLSLTWLAGRLFGFDLPDRVTLMFCGSKKSLVTGVPMANILFPAAQAGAMVLPLMLFHQLQLIVCTVLARRFAGRAADDATRA